MGSVVVGQGRGLVAAMFAAGLLGEAVALPTIIAPCWSLPAPLSASGVGGESRFSGGEG